jgi:hypothetical protein
MDIKKIMKKIKGAKTPKVVAATHTTLINLTLQCLSCHKSEGVFKLPYGHHDG